MSDLISRQDAIEMVAIPMVYGCAERECYRMATPTCTIQGE